MFTKRKTQNFLTMIPEQTVKEFTETEGIVTLLVPKFKSETLQKWLIPKRKSTHFHIRLDETGSMVWILIDGKRTVEVICNELADSLVIQEKPANFMEERVTKYLSELYKSRFIKFKSE